MTARLNKEGFGRGPSRVPVVTEERLRWATERVIDAARALSRDIDDRALRLAVVSRLQERDEIATAEDRRTWREIVERRAEMSRRALARTKRTPEGQPIAEPIAEPQEEP